MPLSEKEKPKKRRQRDFENPAIKGKREQRVAGLQKTIEIDLGKQVLRIECRVREMRKKSIDSGGHEPEEEIAEKQDSGIFQQPRDRQLKNSRGKIATVDEFNRLGESVEGMGEGDGKRNSASPNEKTSFAAMVDSLSLEPTESHRVKEGNAENSVPAQVNESLPPRLFASDRYPNQSRVNSYSNPEYLLDIVKVLDETSEYDWLKRSCFGRLLELPINKSSLSGKLVHQFISRSLMTHKKHELLFVFGGYPMRFSLREFALLTGLNCNPYPRKDLGKKIQYTVEEEEDYWHVLLGPKQNYEIDEIVDMLKLDKRLPATQRMTGGRRLHLALIVLVDGILTCNSSHVRASREVVDMLEDVATFVKYPWGRRSFEQTIEVANVGSKIMSTSVLTSKLYQSHFTTHGFTLALQLLILNSIPKLESWLPQANKDATFETRSVNKLKKLRTFHNANIVEAKQHVDLQVVPILQEGYPLENNDVSWPDEAKDFRVDNICQRIENGPLFKRDEWWGGRNDQRLLTEVVGKEKTNDVSQVNDGARTKLKGKKWATERILEKGIRGCTRQETGENMKGDETVEEKVERLNNENISKLMQMFEIEKNILRDELYDSLLQALRKELVTTEPLANPASANRGEGSGKAEKVGNDKEVDVEGIVKNVMSSLEAKSKRLLNFWDEDISANESRGEIKRRDDENAEQAAASTGTNDEMATWNFDLASAGKGNGIEDSGGIQIRDGWEGNIIGRAEGVIVDEGHNLGEDVNDKDKDGHGKSTDRTTRKVDDKETRQNDEDSGEKQSCHIETKGNPEIARDTGGNWQTQCVETDIQGAESEAEEILEKRQMEQHGIKNVYRRSKRPCRNPNRFGFTEEKEETTMSTVIVEKTTKLLGYVATEKITKFMEFLAANRDSEFKVCGLKVTTTFFKQIYVPKGHLNSQAMLHLVWRRLSGYEESRRIAILDTWFMHGLRCEHDQYTKATVKGNFTWNNVIQQYIQGNVPNRQGKIRWTRDMDFVYAPMHWGTGHWVAVVINLKGGNMEILDALTSLNSTRQVTKLMKPVVEILPKLLTDMAKLEEVSYKSPAKFEYRRVSDIYQNHRTGDCGPLTVKFIEMHAHGIGMDALTDRNVDELRMEYAIGVVEELIGPM